MSKAYSEFHLQPIAGKWREGSAKSILSVTDPFDQQLLCEIAMANEKDVDQAYDAARQAQRNWAAQGPSARSAVLLRAAQILDERHEELVGWIIRESGSTRIKAEIELHSARDITLEAASFPNRAHGQIVASDIPHKESLIYRKPLGVVGLISPWNFPFHLTQRSLAPALALGNAVVIKPASDTPISGGLLLAKVFEEAGLPPGVLSVLVGAGNEIGGPFVRHSAPGLISFTGSTPVGQNIAQQVGACAHLKHVVLELGGNNPFVVLADADLEQAVKAAVFGKFLHQGQICMAINRIIVEAPLYDAFITGFIERVRSLKVGDPKDQDTAVGPVINVKQLQGHMLKVEQAKAEGAKLLLGSAPQGQLFPPHVFVDVTPEMALAREEIFGPIVGILRADNEEHALLLANDTEFGLSAAVFTADLARGVRFARRIESGMAHVNDIPVADAPNVPFGGEKNSGIGRFNGEWAINEFTTTQWVTVQSEPRAYPF